ncbi:MAG: YicC family protein [Firmicutes bacterium]|nr:YicC family protein [Bacillota bacterium]HPU01060.1 YicC family protein [Bacillota bacterium]
MLRSMTGYGRGSCSGENFSVTAELRSVNHRYADFFLRLPRELYCFEDRIRRLLQKEIRRGRVEATIALSGSPAAKVEIDVNEALAAAYCRALQKLAERLALPFDLGLAQLIQLPDVLRPPQTVPTDEQIWPFLEKALQEALENLVKQREEEGSNLARDLELRLEKLSSILEEMATLAPLCLEEQKKRLESRLGEMLGAHFDQGRVLMECAILAERVDFHEELVRMGSHLESFQKTLRSDGPVGRRLDFIAQEIFREVNTVGAKQQDYRIAEQVVKMKTELEKMREQIQNIE